MVADLELKKSVQARVKAYATAYLIAWSRLLGYCGLGISYHGTKSRLDFCGVGQQILRAKATYDRSIWVCECHALRTAYFVYAVIQTLVYLGILQLNAKKHLLRLAFKGIVTVYYSAMLQK